MKKILSILIIVAMVLTSVNFVYVQNIEAKNTVKSLKVLGAKKKMTMKVGSKKVFKVKVKAKSKKTGFKVKSSSKKVVVVKKRGKKIVLTAKAVGKAKITVRSKANKKKKYVMTITVRKNEKKPDVKPETKLLVDAESVNSDLFFVKFSKSVKISKSDLVVQKLISKDGTEKYEDVNKIISLDSEDNKTYAVFLEDESIVPGVKVKFTIKVSGKEFEAECKTTDDSKPATFKDTFLEEKGEEIDELVFTAEEKNGKLLSFEYLPEGLAYNYVPTSNHIEITGAISETGIFNTVAKIESENGVVNVYNIIFVVGDEKTLCAYCEDVNDYVYYDEKNPKRAEGYFDIYVWGGSYAYGYKILDGSDSCFKVYNEKEYDYDEQQYYSYAELSYENVEKPGEYTANIEIFDYNNKKIKTTITCKLIVKGLNKISGKITDKKGKLINQAFLTTYSLDNEESLEDMSFTDSEGNYEMLVSPGAHIIEASFNDARSCKQRKITVDTKVDLVIEDLYEVKISYDKYFVMGNPKYWFKDDGTYTSFAELYYYRFELDSYMTQDLETIYLPKGHHKLITCGIAYKDGEACKYSASMELDVKEDMNAVAYIEKKEVYNGTTMNLDNAIHFSDMSNGGYVQHFTPQEDGEYVFSFGYDADYDLYNPYAELLGEDLYICAEDKGASNKNIKLNVNLKAGKTYYYHYGVSDLGFDSLIIEEGAVKVKKAP